MANDIRELTAEEIEIVSGGSDDTGLVGSGGGKDDGGFVGSGGGRSGGYLGSGN